MWAFQWYEDWQSCSIPSLKFWGYTFTRDYTFYPDRKSAVEILSRFRTRVLRLPYWWLSYLKHSWRKLFIVPSFICLTINLLVCDSKKKISTEESFQKLSAWQNFPKFSMSNNVWLLSFHCLLCSRKTTPWLLLDNKRMTYCVHLLVTRIFRVFGNFLYRVNGGIFQH
jgi:hypothetical protein